MYHRTQESGTYCARHPLEYLYFALSDEPLGYLACLLGPISPHYNKIKNARYVWQAANLRLVSCYSGGVVSPESASVSAAVSPYRSCAPCLPCLLLALVPLSILPQRPDDFAVERPFVLLGERPYHRQHVQGETDGDAAPYPLYQLNRAKESMALLLCVGCEGAAYIFGLCHRL